MGVVANTGGVLSSGSSSATHSVTRPSGRQVGDVILYLFAFDNSTSITDYGPTTEENNVYDAADPSRNIDTFILWEKLSGTVSDTWTITLGAARIAAYAAYLIRGAYPTTTMQSVVNGEQDLAGSAPNPGSISPAWGTEETLFFAYTGHDDGTSTVDTFPSGYSDTVNYRDNTSGGIGLGIGWKQATAASEDPSAFALSASEEYVVNTVAVRLAQAQTLTGTLVTQAGVAYDGTLVPDSFLTASVVEQAGVPNSGVLYGADFLRPVIDTASGGWLGSVKDIDEEPASDTDFVYSPAAPNRVALIDESWESGDGGWTLNDCTRENVGAGAYDGSYVIQCSRGAGLVGTLDAPSFITIDPLARYRVSLAAKKVSGTTSKMYVGMVTRNSAADYLYPNYSAIIQNTLTYLTAAAGPTDTSITVADATNWVDGNSAAVCLFDVWPDFSDVESGRAYNQSPPGPASINIPVGGISGNVISLESAVGGTGYPAGTWVRCHRHTGTFMYPVPDKSLTGSWVVYEGYFGPGFQSLRDRFYGSPNLAAGDGDTWRPGSVDFKPYVLLNYESVDATVSHVDSFLLERLDNVKIVKLETTWETGLDGRDHVRYRYRKDVAVGTVNLKVTLLQRATSDPFTKNKYTEIESWQHNNIGTGWTSQKQTITNDAGITNRLELYLQFEATSS